MDDDIGDATVVEHSDLRRQFERPFAVDCACTLERQEALVAEIEIEHTAIVLGVTRSDGSGHRKGDALQRSIDLWHAAHIAVFELQLDAYVGVRTDHARDREPSRFEQAPVMPWI